MLSPGRSHRRRHLQRLRLVQHRKQLLGHPRNVVQRPRPRCRFRRKLRNPHRRLLAHEVQQRCREKLHGSARQQKDFRQALASSCIDPIRPWRPDSTSQARSAGFRYWTIL